MTSAQLREFLLNSLFLCVLTTGLLPHASVSAAEAVEPALDNQERELVQWLDTQEAAMLSLLEQLTNINSGSLNKPGIDAIASVFSAELRQLGFTVGTLPGGIVSMPSCPGNEYVVDLADHLLASKSGSGPKLLLMGHMDTVFPPESPFQKFTRLGDTMFGPGVSDMKGGLVIMLYALKALAETGELDGKSISILLNSDEEVGSLTSRKYVEEQSLLHDYGLVYESSGSNDFVRTRKGLGQARFVVHGVASHAGAAHERGRSAIKELAYKIVEIEKLTDYDSGVTVNVGVISGGEARNTIAPCAEALVDLRYPEPQQGLDALAAFESIFSNVFAYPADSYPVGSGELTTASWVSLHRPPKIPTEQSDYLLDKSIAIGRLLGQELGIADSGGGTDGSLSQAVGLPTLDSLGSDGGGAHSELELARVSSLLERAKLSAILIHRLSTLN